MKFIHVRVIATGEIREVTPEHPVVLALDVFPSDRGLAIYGHADEYLSRCDARAWACVCPGQPAYVLETGGAGDLAGCRWLLAELPEAAGIGVIRERARPARAARVAAVHP